MIEKNIHEKIKALTKKDKSLDKIIELYFLQDIFDIEDISYIIQDNIDIIKSKIHFLENMFGPKKNFKRLYFLSRKEYEKKKNKHYKKRKQYKKKLILDIEKDN